jgi:multiple sugar transport system ATP-binding protein
LLNGGHIEQQGQPLAVYNAPASRFVGEFIGSPPMNFIPVDRDGETLKGGAWNVPLSAVELQTDTELPRQLWFGVRPESFRVATDAEPAVTGTVDWVERTGSDSYVYARVDDTPIIARVEPGAASTLEAGATVRLAFGGVRLFGRDDGVAVGI